ncbi:MAG TPA: non-canonical purine NTP pyrophosphatase [Bacillota bacterium]|nr:non-canonical purine NTP pyrophosphatase [Bacillota bacterium]
MQRIAVESSDLVSIGYDPKERVLEIEFKEDRVYQYFDVAPDVYERFMRTESYGEFFYAFINRQYRYRRVGKAPEQASDRSLAFVTGNTRKLQQLRAVCEPLAISIEQLELPVDEIQGNNAHKIALHKAKEAFRLARRPVLVMDEYWNILALRGFPGAYMKDVDKWLRPEDFLALLTGKNDRTIGCTETIVYYDGKRAKAFTKDHWGKVLESLPSDLTTFRQAVVMDGDTRSLAAVEADDVIAQDGSLWQEFAKWFVFQRRLKRV